MDSPLPSPRSNFGETKKPIPTPRRSVKSVLPQKNAETESIPEEPKEEHNNTLTKRVSSASKQLAGDISQLVLDRKKAVIQGTRQSVRRIARRFSSSSQEQNTSVSDKEPQVSDEDTINIFSTIRFNSPISQSENIYNNVDNDNVSLSSDEELVGLPPPSHPPPPLPLESVYDAPSSAASSLNSEHSNHTKFKPEVYESVFPTFPLSRQQSDSDSASGTNSERFESLSRSGSWRFYDPVSVTSKDKTSDNVYNNTPISPRIVNNGRESVDFNSNVSMGSSVNVTNSVYENHELIPPSRPPRPSKSVILQFDPLTRHDKKDTYLGSNNDIRALEELLQGDLYGTISNAYTLDELSISNESETDDIVNPPTPPIRVDSLPEDEEEEKKEETNPKPPLVKSRTNWFMTEPSSPTTVENKKHSWFKQVKEVLEKAPEVVRGMKNRDSVVERASLGVKTFVQKRGMLYKVQNGPVEDLFGEYSGRWCVLENANFFCYSDNTCQNLKEHFQATNILSIQILQDKKYNYKYDNDELHCFELNTVGKSRGGHIYGSRNISERRIWMQFLAESLTNRFSTKITTNFIRMGWTYIREGVSGKWVGAWIILSEREFYYAIDNQSVKKMDLRKARCIILQPYQETDNNPRTNDKGPNMLIDCPDIVLYLRMWTSRETKVWCHIIKLEAHNNGANLDQQQLTKNDTPVIVEKCINFVYAHGSMSEGIYRRSGTGSTISDLLSKFRKDAFAVQLTTDQYSEYEVATALKRFFRDLPEPLLGSNQRQYLQEVSKHNNKDERIRMYKAALDQLPVISYNTTRKLLGHLHFISSQSNLNLMTVENLASIWGPTLLYFEDNEGMINNLNYGSSHQRGIEVVNQMISLYRHIFPEDPGELEKEKLMLSVLKKYSNGQGEVVKRNAGDLRVWIYLHNKEGQSFNVSVGPNKTAYDICKELHTHTQLLVHELVLEEVILKNKLIRPIHHEEKVLDVVLKWGYWDEQDRKDNYLTLAPLSKYWEYIIDKPLPVSGELRFADSKSRLFKLLNFQFLQGKLMCFKDKSGDTILHSWRIEDIVWYVGHESKRNPPTRWTITFMEIGDHSNPVRSKNCPYFGHVLVWNDASTRANWLSAMLKSRYPNNLAPPPNLVAI